MRAGLSGLPQRSLGHRVEELIALDVVQARHARCHEAIVGGAELGAARELLLTRRRSILEPKQRSGHVQVMVELEGTRLTPYDSYSGRGSVHASYVLRQLRKCLSGAFSPMKKAKSRP